MFHENKQHEQGYLFSSVTELPKKQRERLETSWAATFYRDFFSRIDESKFEVLYSDKASRPNVPVNVLVSLEALKAGFGWSDAELGRCRKINPHPNPSPSWRGAYPP